jgi:TRAF3-interacting protein 1
MIELATGVKVKANPLKIVAGLEPEETNALLQLIGKMVIKKVANTHKVDTSKAIKTMNGIVDVVESEVEQPKVSKTMPVSNIVKEEEASLVDQK